MLLMLPLLPVWFFRLPNLTSTAPEAICPYCSIPTLNNGFVCFAGKERLPLKPPLPTTGILDWAWFLEPDF